MKVDFNNFKKNNNVNPADDSIITTNINSALALIVNLQKLSSCDTFCSSTHKNSHYNSATNSCDCNNGFVISGNDCVTSYADASQYKTNSSNYLTQATNFAVATPLWGGSGPPPPPPAGSCPSCTQIATSPTLACTPPVPGTGQIDMCETCIIPCLGQPGIGSNSYASCQNNVCKWNLKQS